MYSLKIFKEIQLNDQPSSLKYLVLQGTKELKKSRLYTEAGVGKLASNKSTN